jgi:hypothetical protein
MRALHHLYTSCVLWLLSVTAKDVVAAIHKVGYDDGMQALHKDIVRACAISATDRMRAYNQGYRDAMRFYGDDSADEAPIERVM